MTRIAYVDFTGDGPCNICFNPLPVGEMDVVQTACNHLYCADCIMMWYAINPVCPVCRAVITVAVPSADTFFAGVPNRFATRGDALTLTCAGPLTGRLPVLQVGHIVVFCSNWKEDSTAEMTAAMVVKTTDMFAVIRGMTPRGSRVGGPAVRDS